ncbi:MAG TPA: helix-turn-helix transcriptional regulator [Conexibacter sp.]|nr:helix-turn-helix transcriptional regulator [Conexibacter sp.]
MTLRLVGRRLREERERCGYRLEAAAGELGIDKSVLSRIEHGERGLDSVLLRRTAALYERPMDAFFAEAPRELLVKARDLGGGAAEVDAMVEWTRRKLEELRFVREELGGRDR